jgi:hypothetical protein
MRNFSWSRWLASSCFLLLPALGQARACKIETASAPVHATVSAKHGCLQKVEAKVCAPSGKTPKSSAVRDLNASPNVDFKSEVNAAGGGCVEGTVTVRARDVIGPPFLQYCSEGIYEGRLEVLYCR